VQVQRHSNGQKLTLSEVLGSGGEGKIYAVPGTDWVAKIYHQPTQEMALKLVAMIADRPDDPTLALGHVSIAWPLDLLWQNRQVVGFLMPRVTEMLPLHTVWTPKNRRDRLPLFNYLYLHRTARNLAATFASIHASGHVVGDVNESNILVNQRALVSLVDTDSFQILDRSRQTVYPCPVGKPEFTPPELQGQVLRSIKRTEAQDRFGLAVAIYQLLMEGTHPYAGVFQGTGDPPSIADRIAAGHFLHNRRVAVPYRPTPIAPDFRMLAPRLQHLFCRCFEAHHPRDRPDATTWLQALEQSEQTLVACDQNAQHRYDERLNACPWCDRTQKLGGRDPFPQRATDAQRWKDQPRKAKSRVVATAPAAAILTGLPRSAARSPSPASTTKASAQPSPPYQVKQSFPAYPHTAYPPHYSPYSPYSPPIALWTDLWRYRYDLLAGGVIVGLVLATIYGVRYAQERQDFSAVATFPLPASLTPFSTSPPPQPALVSPANPILALTDRYYGHTSPITAIAIDPETGRFASVSSNGIVRVWNRKDAPEDQLYEQPIGTSPAPLVALSFTSDSQTLIGITAGISDEGLEGSLEGSLAGTSSRIDPGTIAATSARELLQWDSQSLNLSHRQPLEAMSADAAEIYTVAMQPTGTIALGSTPETGLTLWQLEPWSVIRSINSSRAQAASISANGKVLALVDQEITLWDLETGQYRGSLAVPIAMATPDEINSPSRHPIAIALSPEGQYIAIAQPEVSETVELWSVTTNQLVQSVLAPEIVVLQFSADGRSLFGGDRQGAISHWRVEWP